MLKHLSYFVTFPSTGRTLAADVAFRPGFGVITGPNESGKTAHIELVRFCLFGSAALRGKTEDYKSLKAELGLTIRGESYRTGVNEEQLAAVRNEASQRADPARHAMLEGHRKAADVAVRAVEGVIRYIEQETGAESCAVSPMRVA